MIQDDVAETILTISAVYGSYALAIALGASGLVAVAIVGLYFGGDIRTISTMVFGVAFLSIVIQVPLLSRYVKRKFAGEVEVRRDRTRYEQSAWERSSDRCRNVNYCRIMRI